jgi:hypothetical protein
MPYLNEGKKTKWASATDGAKPSSREAVKMPAPVRIPQPAVSKAK